MRGALRSLILVLLTAGSSVAALLGDRLLPGGNRAERVMGWWGRAFVRLGGWTLRVEGMENLPSGGAVLVANHQSVVDIPMLLSAFPRPVGFLAKRELGEIPLFGKAMAAAGNLFVDRDDPRDAVRMLREAGARLRDGRLVVVFPEGTRSGDGSIGEFRTGAFYLAQKSGAPVVPVYLDGGYRAIPKGGIRVRPAELLVRVLPPLSPEEGAGGTKERIAASVRARLIREGREMTLRVIPMGGLGEIGLNCMLFDDGGSALLIDAGLLFPDDTMLGVDYVVPDFSVLRETAPHLGALLLTHGHEDHIGAVPFLLREFDIPIYGTRLTLGLLRHRLAEHGLEASARLFPIARDARFRVGNFDVEAFPVCHSIPDAVGYVLRCPEGIFVHTGDFKIDPYPLDGVPTGVERLRAISASEGVTALFSDSTNVEREGVSPPEKFVGEALAEIFGQAPGRVVVGMFSSNLHRIQEAIKAAYACGRRVALCGKSMVRNVATAIDLGYLALPSADILIPVEEAVSLPDRAVAVLTTGSQGEPRSALTLMALGEHKHLKVRPRDTIVLSSKFIPGNERAIAGVINRFFLAGAEVLYEKISEVHVSGHASVEELRTMIAAVRPANFVPVHGEPRLLVRHRNLAREGGVPRVAMLRNGDVLAFSGGRCPSPGGSRSGAASSTARGSATSRASFSRIGSTSPRSGW